MKKLLFCVGISLLLVACNVSQKHSDSKITDKNYEINIPQSGCFASLTRQDSIWLKLKFSSNIVTGTLIYQLSEKDKNEGTLYGSLNGDTLLADYTFRSEGKTSVREVAFLVKKDTVIEGFGDMEMQNGNLVFKDNSEIDFTNGIIFQKRNCATLHGAFD